MVGSNRQLTAAESETDHTILAACIIAITLFHRASLTILVNKPYPKVVTHSEEVEWWRILMVECGTICYSFYSV